MCVDTPIFSLKNWILFFWASFLFWSVFIHFRFFVFVKVVHFSYKHLHFFDKVVRNSYKVLRNPYKVVWNFCHFCVLYLQLWYFKCIFYICNYTFSTVLYSFKPKIYSRTNLGVIFLPHYTIRRCFTDDFYRKGNQMLSYMQ